MLSFTGARILGLLRVAAVLGVLGLGLTATAPAAPAPPAASPLDEFATAAPYFETVGDIESIPMGVVAALAQDAQGFIWIGTPMGLVRYDGYHFRKFVHDPAESGSLAGNSVRSLWAARDGRLWVGTNSDGLSVFDPQTERFKHFRNDPNEPDSLSPGMVRALVGDAEGGLWIGTDGGLDYLADGATALRHFRHKQDAASSLPDERVRSLLIDDQGKLWIGTATGLVRHGADGFASVGSDPAAPDSLAGQEICSMLQAADGKLWIGSRTQGAALLDPKSLRLGWLEVDPSRPDRLSHAFVYSIAQPRPDELWLGTGGGVVRVAAADGQVRQVLRHDPSIAGSLANDDLGALMTDRSGLLWIGGWGGGLQRFDARHAVIHHLRHSPLRKDGLSESAVHSVLKRADGALLVGLGTQGIDVVDRRRGRIDGWRAQPGRPGSLADGTVLALAQTADGTLWAGTRQAGVQRLKSGASNWDTLGVAQGLPHTTVHTLYVSRQGELWVGTVAGLARWLPKQGRFEASTQADGGLLAVFVTALAEDAQGRLWTASSAGLWLLEPGATGLQVINHEPQRPDSLSSDDVKGLLVDHRDRLWVDTANGLDRLIGWDRKHARFDHISAQLGRPGLNFGSNLLEDRRGRIWTQRIVFDPERMKLHELGKADGMEIGTAWAGSYGKTHDDLLLFGGTRGLALIDPERFEPWDYAPPVVATELKIDGESQSLGALQPDLRLRPDQGRFSVSFAALDYSAPQENRYAYRLLGYDRDWIEADAEHRVASYGGLWPGDYTLKVRGSGRGGEWSPHRLRVPITVLPAFWQTAWFAALIAMLAGGSVIGGFRWRTARLRAKAVALQRLVEARTTDILKLGEIGKELTATLDLEEAFTRVYRQVSARLDAHVFLLGRLDAGGGHIRVDYAMQGGARLPPFEFALRETDHPAICCVRERREVVMARAEDLLNDVNVNLPAKAEATMESIVYLPLQVENRVIGCVSVQSPRQQAYNTDQLEFLRVLASYTAIALDKAAAHQQLARSHVELAATHSKLEATHSKLEATHAQLVDTQQQLVQQEKMAALGTLTAGMAHELNNPINFADVAVQNLDSEHKALHAFLRELAGEEAPPEVLAAIAAHFSSLSEMTAIARDGHRRIAAIVRGLRQFTRLDEAEHKAVLIAEPIQSALNLLRGRYPEIEFQLNIDFNPSLDCQPAKLGQALMNLLVNACEAIERAAQQRSARGDGPWMAPALRSEEDVAAQRPNERAAQQRSEDVAAQRPNERAAQQRSDDVTAQRPNERCPNGRQGSVLLRTRSIADEQIEIAVEDNGCGIAATIIEHIFEPFFTTKPVGAGTGLGLSIAFGIVKQHGGSIEAQSLDAGGACLIVRLPIR